MYYFVITVMLVVLRILRRREMPGLSADLTSFRLLVWFSAVLGIAIPCGVVSFPAQSAGLVLVIVSFGVPVEVTKLLAVIALYRVIGWSHIADGGSVVCSMGTVMGASIKGLYCVPLQAAAWSMTALRRSWLSPKLLNPTWAARFPSAVKKETFSIRSILSTAPPDVGMRLY